MRTLSATLAAAQKTYSYPLLAKVVLTKSGESTQTYTISDRILPSSHSEGAGLQNAEVLLDNSDKALSSLDLRGYQGVISYGITTSGGDEYSATAPLKVISQQFVSAAQRRQGINRCHLSLVGIPNLVQADKANADYVPASDDTNTVKTIIEKILGDSGETILACFDHCTSYDVDFDSEDALIDVFQPKDSFSITIGQSRLDKVIELLNYTKCVMRYEDDGKFHIFVPTTTGTSYDYEYNMASGSHTFFDKTNRKRVVVPNYIVVSSHPSHGDGYTGYAEDTDSSDLLEVRDYKYVRAASNAQCTALATAILSHYQANAEQGHGHIPMNVGAEVHDYVKITDARADDTRTGNIGYLTRSFGGGRFDMEFRFGDPDYIGIQGTLPPITTSGGGGGISPDITNIINAINDLYSYIQKILNQLQDFPEYVDRLLGYVYINAAGDVVISPKNGQWVQLLGDLSLLGDEHIGPLLSTANARVFWHDSAGTYDHAFCPETDGHGKIGDTNYKFLEGHIKKIYCDTEMYIPAEA